jgi:ribonuclease-3 family protein
MNFNKFKGEFSDKNIREMNPLVLAYIGDSVYELFIRTSLVNKNRNMLAHKLHSKAIQYVKAHGQYEALIKIEENLNEEEIYFFKRGRNCKSATVPKNASVQEYRIATGFETLLGFLYLSERKERLNEILNIILEQ